MREIKRLCNHYSAYIHIHYSINIIKNQKRLFMFTYEVLYQYEYISYQQSPLFEVKHPTCLKMFPE